jgi:hypothetical protein
MQTFDPETKLTTDGQNVSIDLTEGDDINKYYNDRDILVMDNVLSIATCEEIKSFIDNQCANNSSIIMRQKLCRSFDNLSNLIIKYLPQSIQTNYPISSLNIHNSYNHWTFDNINHFWRFVKCNVGSKLPSHFDGVYVKSVDHRSFFTIMVYLSTNTDGSLFFPEKNNLTILPKIGRIVIFDQKLLHSGLINSDTKYFIRSEALYMRSNPMESEADKIALELYNEAKEINAINPEKSRLLEKEAFELSPLLENTILNLY